MKFCEVCGYQANDRGDDENSNIEPVNVCKGIFPSESWESLCRLKSMFNVNVRDVEVGGDVMIEF